MIVNTPFFISPAYSEPRITNSLLPNDRSIDVDDVKAEAERLRAAAVDVGVVVEVHGQIRLLDVFDPDGNRIQLTQELTED